jgi:hypothetical protein
LLLKIGTHFLESFQQNPPVGIWFGRRSKLMSISTETLLRQALELPPDDRAALVEGLSSAWISLTRHSMRCGSKKLKIVWPPIGPESLARLTLTRFSLSWGSKLESSIPAPGAP